MLVSIYAGKANQCVTKDVPSDLIPFKGKFPILPEYLTEEYQDTILKTEEVKDCPDWVQDVLVKGERIYTMDKEFREYLKNNGISVEFFKKKSSADKATELYRFLDANSLTLNSLKI